MKQKTVIFITLIFTLALFSFCGKDDDKALLLLATSGLKDVLKNMPSEVPPGDLFNDPNAQLDGSGEVISLTGSSSSPQDYQNTNSQSNSENDGEGSDSASGNDNANSGASGHEGEGSSSASEDDTANSGASGHEGEGSSSASEDNTANGDASDDGDGNRSPVRHGKDVCSAEGTWYKDANTIFTYENKPASFCFSQVEAGRYEVVLMVKHWVKHNSKSVTVPGGYHEYEVLVSEGGNPAIAAVPVNMDHWEKGSVFLNISNPDPVISVSLSNPYCDDTNCVNLQILSVHLKKDNGSAIAASIKEISEKHYPLILGIFAAALAVILLLNYKKSKLNQS